MLGYFHTPARDARRAPQRPQEALAATLAVEPLSEPVGGRSWCLTGHMPDTSERLLITTVIERWGGKIAPEKELVP